MATVGIDLGHGKNTFPPSKGLYKDGKAYHEHTFNANVGIQLDAILKRHGIKTYMAQKPFATDVPLTTRTNRYNRENVDLIVSIHANAGVSSAKGVASFYWYKDAKAKRLAEYYEDEARKARLKLWGGARPSTKGDWSEFHMCREPYEDGIPSILTENGFMTNSEDFQKIFKDPAYIKLMAEIHAKTVCRYLGITYKPETKKEENEMEKNAVVYHSFVDQVAVGQPLQNKLNCGNYTKEEAERRQVAENVYVVGGDKGKIKGKVHMLSGADRWETFEKVRNFLK
jgi:N-acetylmuramoyl-L-alanine amidase